MEIVGVSDTHSNFFNNHESWELTLENLIDGMKGNETFFSLGDVVGRDNLVIYRELGNNPSILVPGNHDVEEIIQIKINSKRGGVPIDYLIALGDENVWNELSKFGYGTNVKYVKNYFAYFIIPERNFVMIVSHFPLKRDKETMDYLASYLNRRVKYVYNIYGHTHSSHFNIFRERIRSRNKYTGEKNDAIYISVHLPPFYRYRCGWKVDFDGKRVEIKEVYFAKGDLIEEKVRKPKVGEVLE